MRVVFAAALLAAALSTSCASTSADVKLKSMKNAGKPHPLVKHATFDLNCPRSQLSWIQLDEHTYGVRGCGMQVRYRSQCAQKVRSGYSGSSDNVVLGGFNYVTDECQWVRDGAVEPLNNYAAPEPSAQAPSETL